MRRILLTSTSYPRSADDWQAVFIRDMLRGLVEAPETAVSYWGPPGPLPDDVEYAASAQDAAFLRRLAEHGGIAHRLRTKPVAGLLDGIRLVRRLRRALSARRNAADVFHLNWLQSGLGIPGSGQRVLLTVLGSDYRLLQMPGVTALLRARFARNHVALAPNAEWMVPDLEARFGQVTRAVRCVPFGIENRYYDVAYRPDETARRWITVVRLTRAKLGPLLDWAGPHADDDNEFHLFGPMQERIDLPAWIRYHGPVTPGELADRWYPQATGMITLSRHDEGRPQVLLEAQAAGVPVIASRLPAHDDLVDATGGGILVGDQAEFAAALAALADPDSRARYSEAARQAVRSIYGTWDDCARRYLSLYDELEPDSAT